MTTRPTTPPLGAERSEDSPPTELVVLHFVVVLDTAKGWRTTVRIQDGWQGATLSHWSRGGADLTRTAKAFESDVAAAMEEGFSYLATF